MILQSHSHDESRQGNGFECWCLHGNVGLASDWRNFTNYLASSGSASRAVDLWRFLCCEPLSLRDSATALNAEAVASGPLPKVIVAYSLGARIALHSILHQPCPWHAAILISSHPGLEAESERVARRASDANWAASAFSGDWNQFLNSWNAQPILKGALPRPESDQRRLLARRGEIARGFVSWSLGQQSPLWGRLPQVQIPVLWVVGVADPRYLELAQRAVQLNPLFQLAAIPNAGHRVPWEEPEAFRTATIKFLSEVVSSKIKLPQPAPKNTKS